MYIRTKRIKDALDNLVRDIPRLADGHILGSSKDTSKIASVIVDIVNEAEARVQDRIDQLEKKIEELEGREIHIKDG